MKKIYFTPAVEKTLHDLNIFLPSMESDLYNCFYAHPLAQISKGISLKVGVTDFSNSVKLYQKGCEVFGWDERLQSEFGWNTPVYANKATEEGFGVWCPCNNNICLDSDSIRTRTIQNYVDENRIVELVFNAQRQFLGQYDKEDSRVTFIKLPDGSYAFYGVIERISLNRFERFDGGVDTLLIREYKKISDSYPFSIGDKKL